MEMRINKYLLCIIRRSNYRLFAIDYPNLNIAYALISNIPIIGILYLFNYFIKKKVLSILSKNILKYWGYTLCLKKYFFVSGLRI